MREKCCLVFVSFVINSQNFCQVCEGRYLLALLWLLTWIFHLVHRDGENINTADLQMALLGRKT